MPTNVATSTLDLVPGLATSFADLGPKFSQTTAPELGKAGALGGGRLGKTLMRSLGPLVLYAGAAAIGQAAFGYLKGAVGRAADLEQSLGAVDAVFKGSAGQLLGWADDSVSRVGLAKAEYADLGTLIGAQFKNAGVPMDQLAPKTDSVITLGADLAAQFGGSTSDAVGALSSALRGETDPVERYGISLTAAAVSAEAARLGFTKVGGEFDLAAKQAATLSLIQAQSGDAMGTFARESDTLANKQQRLGAMWRDGAARIGTTLLPAVSGLASLLIGILGPSLTGAERAITGVTRGVSAIYGALAGMPAPDLAPGPLASIVGALPSLSAVGAFLAPTVQAFSAYLPALASTFSTLVGPLLTVLTSISPVGIVLRALLPVLPQVAALVGQLAASLAGGLVVVVPLFYALSAQLAEVMGNQLGLMVSILVPAIVAFAQMWVAEVIPSVVALWSGLLPLVGALLTGLVPVVTSLVSVMPTMVGAFVALLAGILPVVGQIAQALLPVVAAVVPLILGLVTALVPLIAQLVGAVGPVLTAVVPLLGAIIAALLPVVSVIASVLLPVVEALLPVVATVFASIADVIRAALQIVSGIIAVVTGVVTGNWSQVWAGLGTIVSGAWALIKAVILGAIANAAALVRGLLALIRSLFVSAWSGLGGVVSGAWSSFTGAISSGIGDVGSFLAGVGPRLLSGLGDLTGMLVSVGRNMLLGLVDGVKESMSRLAEGFLAPIRNSVEGVKSFLGIASPSRLLIAAGEEAGELIGSRSAVAPAPLSSSAAFRAEQADEPSSGDEFNVYGAADPRATAAAIARRRGADEATVRSILDAPSLRAA